MIAERLALDMERSFGTLRTYARNHNLRLADVAIAVIADDIGAETLDPLPSANL